MDGRARIDAGDLKAVVAMLRAPGAPVDRMTACRIDALGRGRFLAFTGVRFEGDDARSTYEHDGGKGVEEEASVALGEGADGIAGAFALVRRLGFPAGLSVSLEFDADGARAEARTRGTVGAPLAAASHENPGRAVTAALLSALLLLEETPSLRRA